ncbi:hypothetical protein [Labedaea rhizosphaerae]|uniref:Uncharacterized protein n=1 Tax=Labedaea rhizosphaerae TaxID=598644 RepID=A0A4R6SL44_LABRH|nr:hypothetical protein [Labedaea rhizosphaerae]TDQ04799.1 hypothetical protein EV186_101757 [Labedaea rhizosphaerae]
MSNQLPDPTDISSVRAWLNARHANPAAVREWARPLVVAATRHGPIPPLGGPEWRALPDCDPRKLAALIPMALARLDESTPAAIASRLRRELDESDRLTVARLRQMSHDLSAAIADANRGRRSARPTYAELALRRNTFPCVTCRRRPVVHPQTVCHACSEPNQRREDVAA